MPNLRSGSQTGRTTRSKRIASILETGQIDTGANHNDTLDFATLFKDTIKQSPAVSESTDAASTASVFHLKQPAPLSKSKKRKFTFKPIDVHQDKCISSWIVSLFEKHPEYKDKVAVVISASSSTAGGIMDSVNQVNQPTTQEQILCATSTLYNALKVHESEYPWPNFACPGPGPDSRNHEQVTVPAIFSPTITIFKSGPQYGYIPLATEQRATVAVISMSPPKNVDEDNLDAIVELGHKLVTILRLAAAHGKTILVLDDFGCVEEIEPRPLKRRKKAAGTAAAAVSTHNPVQVAELVLHIAQNDPEFSGRFEQIFLVAGSDTVCDVFRAVFIIDELGVDLEVA